MQVNRIPVRSHQAAGSETGARRRVGAHSRAALQALPDDAEAIGECGSQNCDFVHVHGVLLLRGHRYTLRKPQARELIAIKPRR